MINYSGSLRYDMHGRKRKVRAKTAPVRASKSDFKPMRLSDAEIARNKEIASHREKYPSAGMGIGSSASADTSWKVEESKNFTVAPAYNKGAYQVIGKSNVKDIGR
jgi:hypothetical protein